MKVTIIPDDKFISVDGIGYMGISTDWSYIPSGINAIQWDGSSGEVEYLDGSPNVGITSLGIYEAAITHHENERLRLVAKEVENQDILDNKDWDSVFRSRRSLRLEDCDWTQGNDSPLSSSKKTEWATYRQTLRDLPLTITDTSTRKAMSKDYNHSNWPTEPS